MILRLLFLCSFTLCLLFPMSLSAQSGGVEVVGTWDKPDLPSHSFGKYNETWGVVVDNHEYGIIGSVRGTHFIDLESNPLKEVFFIAGRDSAGHNVHRDFHSYDHYLYVVCDEGGSSLQIMDFSGLPNSVDLVYDSDQFIYRSHNIFIDEANARLYSTSSVNNWYLSLADPEKPKRVVMSTIGVEPPQQHDIFVKDNIIYLNCQDDGLWIYDVSNPASYQFLGSLTSYPNQGYNHSGWLNEEGTHYILCEETTGADLKMIDVTDLSDLKVKKRFNVGTPYENLPHNAMITGDFLYVSYYYDGLQVYDISDPENPFRIAFYDTYDGESEGFHGAWGVYSKLPSGRILVSDITSGLFLLEITPGNYPITATLKTNTDVISYCENLGQAELVVQIGEGFDEEGVSLDIPNLPADAAFTYSPNPAIPGSEANIIITGLTENISLELIAEDNKGKNYPLSFSVELGDLEEVTPLLEPADMASQIGVSPTFSWDGTLFNVYFLEIATDPDDFEGSLIYSKTIPNAKKLDLPIELISGTYYWRLYTQNECGKTYSEVFEFHTGIVAVEEVEQGGFSVFPNPAREVFTIEIPNNEEYLDLLLFDMQGRQLATHHLSAGQTQITLPISQEAGVYLVQLKGGGKVLTKRVVFTP